MRITARLTRCRYMDNYCTELLIDPEGTLHRLEILLDGEVVQTTRPQSIETQISTAWSGHVFICQPHSDAIYIQMSDRVVIDEPI